jgi:hypothetical protein
MSLFTRPKQRIAALEFFFVQLALLKVLVMFTAKTASAVRRFAQQTLSEWSIYEPLRQYFMVLYPRSNNREAVKPITQTAAHQRLIMTATESTSAMLATANLTTLKGVLAYMGSLVFAQLEILNAVVGSLSVYVMNNFFTPQCSAKKLFHYMTMLKNVTAISSKHCVSISRRNPTTSPSRIILASTKTNYLSAFKATFGFSGLGSLWQLAAKRTWLKRFNSKSSHMRPLWGLLQPLAT